MSLNYEKMEMSDDKCQSNEMYMAFKLEYLRLCKPGADKHSVRGHTGNILNFAGLVDSTAITQPHHGRVKAATDAPNK